MVNEKVSAHTHTSKTSLPPTVPEVSALLAIALAL